MTMVKCLTAAMVLAGLAAPAVAQDTRGYSSFDYPMRSGIAGSQSLDDRMTDFRRTVARRVARDGGTLSERDRRSLGQRLIRIVAEERLRRNPVWPGIVG